MKNQYVSSGRQNQKLQTRNKILETAREFISEGVVYSLEDVAKRADISRATVYRYYSSIDLLSAEAILDLQASTPALVYEELKSTNVEDKLLEIQKYYNDLTFSNETSFRKYLSIVIEEENKASRGGRRLEALRLALSENVSIDQAEREMFLALASLMMGIEAVIVTKDVCGFDNAKAAATLEWGLKTLMETVLKRP